MSYIGNKNAINYINGLPPRLKQSWLSIYPKVLLFNTLKANENLLDLMDHMITFNPDKRYTVKECLAHPYFDGLHNPEEEPECK